MAAPFLCDKRVPNVLQPTYSPHRSRRFTGTSSLIVLSSVDLNDMHQNLDVENGARSLPMFYSASRALGTNDVYFHGLVGLFITVSIPAMAAAC